MEKSNFEDIATLKTLKISQDDFEKVQAEFVSDELLIEPNCINYRVNVKGRRVYARIEAGAVRYAPSWTAVKNKVIPVDSMLARWGRELGQKDYKIFMESSANYGTFLHVLFGRTLRGESFLLHEETLLHEAYSFFLEAGYKFEQFLTWYDEQKRSVRKDLLGFLCWVKDFNIRALAIEYPVFAFDSKIACTLDLVCRMTVGESEIIALVDYKTGLSNFYYDNPYQLLAGAQCWNEEFTEDFQITHQFNYGCNNYLLKTLHKKLNDGKTGKFKPYRWKDQTDEADPELLEHFIKTFHMFDSIMDMPEKVEFDPLFSASIQSELSGALNNMSITETLLLGVENEQDKKEPF